MSHKSREEVISEIVIMISAILFQIALLIGVGFLLAVGAHFGWKWMGG